MIEIVIVAAVAENGVIGSGNEMPWRLKSDLKRFRTLTWGKPVLMGRKTHLSIGRPLPGRTNIVVSRNPDFGRPGVVAAPTLETALEVARADARRRGGAEVMVLGGAEIYAALLARAHRLEITCVHASPAGDAFFPAIDKSIWREDARYDHPAGPEDSARVEYLTYRRREGVASTSR
jgi:dihydrofolate reductase